MQPEEIQALVKRYLNGTSAPGEKELLDQWYQEGQTDPVKWFAESGNEEELLRLEMLHEIQTRTGLKKPTLLKRLWPRIAAAASILLFLSAGAYFMLHTQHPVQQIAQNQIHDIAPGHNQATLTMAGGQKIILTKGLLGKLAQQGNMQVQVNNNHTITYSSTGVDANNTVTYNTMSTKIGEQSPYPLVLADGTQVLLDAKSSITFPVAFTGKERRVKVAGKAWFKVIPNAKQPFFVTTANGQVTKDIGTEFVIDAYDDEPAIKTTLVEGAVRVFKGNASVALKQGEQAINKNGSDQFQIKEVDTEEATGWIHGQFVFRQADIQSVMRQLSRWYSVDYAFDGKIPAAKITGKVYRNVNASQALIILKYLDIHYRIEDKKIIITP